MSVWYVDDVAVASADDRPASATPTPGPSRPATRWVARGVTIGVLVVFAFAAWNTVEAWPITSFRLFSQVRTANASSTTLVAIDADGDAHPVEADPDHPFVPRTKHEYPLLRDATPARAHAMVDAWLRAAGMDPDDFVAVELRRKSLVYAPDGSSRHVTGERTTWRLRL